MVLIGLAQGTLLYDTTQSATHPLGTSVRNHAALLTSTERVLPQLLMKILFLELLLTEICACTF